MKEQLKEVFKAPGTARFRPFARITEGTPHLLSFFALAVFAFSITFTIPSWVPVVGDWIGNKSFDSEALARYLPFLLLLATILVQVRARLTGLKLSAMKDYVLLLALKHGWRRDEFIQLFLSVIETTSSHWVLKLGEWMSKWDPNTLREVRRNLEAKPKDDQSKEDWRRVYREIEKDLLAEDFEARIHSLYYMNKERNFRDWTVILHPFFFALNHRRAIRRLRGLFSDGLPGFVYLGVCSLPGGDDYRIHRRMFPYIAAYELLVIGSSLLWAFIKQPWSGFGGWLGMGVLLLAAIVPMLVWNYHLMVRHRGLPRGMSWEEIQADMRFIRGM